MTSDPVALDLLGAALGYAKRGYLVLPLMPNGKGPLGRLVRHGHLDASSDPEQIQAWWRAEPFANIGIVCGPSSFDALDVDGEEGDRSLSALVERHGAIETRVHKTPRGWHFLFKPGALPTTAGKVGKGLDTRARGTGYIVAPPSRSSSGEVYREEVRAELAEAPQWLVELARGPVPSRPSTDVKARVRKARPGTRNVVLNREAFTAAKGSPTEAQAEAAVSRLVDLSGLPEAEAARVGRKALKAGRKAAERQRERFRRVPAMFTSYSRFHPRTAEAKLIALLICTGSGASAIPGVAVFRPRALAEEASLSEEKVKGAVRELSKRGLLRSDVRAGVYWLPTVTECFTPKSTNEVRAWENALKEYVPRCALWKQIARAIAARTSGHSGALPAPWAAPAAGLILDKEEGSPYGGRKGGTRSNRETIRPSWPAPRDGMWKPTEIAEYGQRSFGGGLS